MSLDDERSALARQIDYLGDSLTRVEAEIETVRRSMSEDIRRAVKEAVPEMILTTDEQRSLKLLIRRQEQAVAFRTAVIEKSLTSLVWAAIVGAALMIREYAIAHGMWRP
jgi:hypothetical protein